MNPWIPHLLRAGGGGGGPVLPPAGRTMLANLKSSLILDEGTGGPTWSRATKAWGFNELGYLEELASGKAFFGGARLVRNLLAATEDSSSGSWVKSTGTTAAQATDSSGGSTAMRFTYGSSQSYLMRQDPNVTNRKATYCLQFRFKTDATHDWWRVMIYDGSGNQCRMWFNAQTGTIGNTVPSGSGVFVSATLTDVGGGWFALRLVGSPGVAGTGTVFAQFSANDGDGSTLISTVASGDAITIEKPSLVDVTGYDAPYVPEYVSVGSDTDKNFLLHTDDFSQAAWLKSNITLTQSAIANPVDGLINAQKVEATAGAATYLAQFVSNCGSPNGNILAFYVKKGSGATDANKFLLRNNTTATAIVSISFDYDTGVVNHTSGSGTVVIDAGDGWYRIEMSSSSGFSLNDTVGIYLGFASSLETAGEFCYIYRPYIGRGVTAPAVLPAVAGVWDPFGAGIDGAKYFETDWQGAPIPAANLLKFRREAAATNSLLWSRDLSNAAWSTKTNITAAKTATGLDGIANTATTLTATAADATILQPITLASAARCASAYVKRRTGTGTISFTQDGGSTWTDITSQINSSTWSRVEITATLANPSVGFKISTSGDAIDVDCVQNEAGAEATSPIVTTTTAITRNADSLAYQTASNWSDTAGTAYIEAQPWQWSVGGLVGSATNGLLESASNSGATAYDGTNAANGPAGSPSGRKKLALRWTGATMDVSVGGVIGTAGTYDGAMGLSSLGIAVNSSGYFGPVAVWNYAMTNDEFKALTT